MNGNRLFAATCTAVLIAVGVGGCGATTPGSSARGGDRSEAKPSTVWPPATSAPTATPAMLAVYYLGTERVWREADGQPVDRIKLYREFHRTPTGDGSAQAKTVKAVGEALATSSAFDPDYRSGWPSGAYVREVQVDGDTVTVDIAGARTNSVGAEVAHQAVQQLVWTATAASDKPGVRLLLDGEQVEELWGHVGIEGVLRRAPGADVLAHVWLIDPQHGATVAQTFTVHVSGYVHESTIQVLVRQGDRTLRETYVTVAGPASSPFGEAKTSLTLPPGTYTVEAYSASNASNGGKHFLDSHTITVG